MRCQPDSHSWHTRGFDLTDPALLATAVPPTAPAGAGQIYFLCARPAPCTTLCTEGLDITSTAPIWHSCSIGVGNDNVPETISSPATIDRGDIGHLRLQASLAQLHTASRRAEANRASRSLGPPIHLSKLELLRLARLPSFRLILSRYERAGVAPWPLDPEARRQSWFQLSGLHPVTDCKTTSRHATSF